MEAVKGVVWDHGQHKVNGSSVHKYVIGMVLITDEPIKGLESGDNVVLDQTQACVISDALSRMKKYDAPYKLGDLSDAVLSVSNFTLDDVEEREK